MGNIGMSNIGMSNIGMSSSVEMSSSFGMSTGAYGKPTRKGKPNGTKPTDSNKQ